MDVARELQRLLFDSPLHQAGGCVVLNLVEPAMLALLQTEVAQRQHEASVMRTTVSLDRGTERGNPDRWLESVPGGPVLNELYADAGLLDALYTLTGLNWVPAGASAAYSFYRAHGHYLGLHRDIEECDLAVIICVYSTGDGDGDRAGNLIVYPSRCHEPLETIQNAPEEGAWVVSVQPGKVVVLLGGLVPHAVTPMQPGQMRIMAPLCYSALPV